MASRRYAFPATLSSGFDRVQFEVERRLSGTEISSLERRCESLDHREPKRPHPDRPRIRQTFDITRAEPSVYNDIARWIICRGVVTYAEIAIYLDGDFTDIAPHLLTPGADLRWHVREIGLGCYYGPQGGDGTMVCYEPKGKPGVTKIERRYTGIAACRAIGLDHPQHFAGYPFGAFWDQHLVLLDFNAEIARSIIGNRTDVTVPMLQKQVRDYGIEFVRRWCLRLNIDINPAFVPSRARTEHAQNRASGVVGDPDPTPIKRVPLITPTTSPHRRSAVR